MLTFKSSFIRIALMSVPITSFFFVSMYICENSYELFNLSSIFINPIDLKIFSSILYSKFSKYILLPFSSVNIAA